MHFGGSICYVSTPAQEQAAQPSDHMRCCCVPTAGDARGAATAWRSAVVMGDFSGDQRWSYSAFRLVLCFISSDPSHPWTSLGEGVIGASLGRAQTS